MTFIDWSDSEAMLGLLVEWIADERLASEDPEREEFLAGLGAELSQLAAGHDTLPLDALIARMRAIHETGAVALPGDPALAHLSDCIVELERLRGEA
jgi:hypothetical protein